MRIHVKEFNFISLSRQVGQKKTAENHFLVATTAEEIELLLQTFGTPCLGKVFHYVTSSDLSEQ